MNDEKKMLVAMAQAIYDKKGFNITALDVRDISTMAQYVLIAEGNVEKHVQALTRTVVDVIKERGEQPLHVDGDRYGDWVVVDCGDIVVHLFAPGVRERYRLEMLWGKGGIVDLDITTGKEG